VVSTMDSVVGDLVASEGTGVVSNMDTLPAAVEAVAANRDTFSAEALNVFRTRYTEAAWVAAIERVYREALSE